MHFRFQAYCWQVLHAVAFMMDVLPVTFSVDESSGKGQDVPVKSCGVVAAVSCNVATRCSLYRRRGFPVTHKVATGRAQGPVWTLPLSGIEPWFIGCAWSSRCTASSAPVQIVRWYYEWRCLLVHDLKCLDWDLCAVMMPLMRALRLPFVAPLLDYDVNVA
jgi:hypothetical protein